MPFVGQQYGKANVRVLRVQRARQRHEVREARVKVTLDGDFARAYTAADNSSVVPTDTMKNLVNVLAFEHVDGVVPVWWTGNLWPRSSAWRSDGSGRCRHGTGPFRHTHDERQYER